jgi:hypothetical protein
MRQATFFRLSDPAVWRWGDHSSINEGNEEARSEVNHMLSEFDGAPANRTGAVSGEFVAERRLSP